MELERKQLLKEIEMVERGPPLEIVINSQESYTVLKEKIKTENPETPPIKAQETKKPKRRYSQQSSEEEESAKVVSDDEFSDWEVKLKK